MGCLSLSLEYSGQEVTGVTQPSSHGNGLDFPSQGERGREVTGAPFPPSSLGSASFVGGRWRTLVLYSDTLE